MQTAVAPGTPPRPGRQACATSSRLERLKAAPRKPGEASFFFYDAHFRNDAVKVLPGEYFVHDEDLLIMTTLGSCIAACLWDRERRVGGMNHFMLPEGGGGADGGRYGSFAMELLINELIKRGATRSTMEAKVFGGGAVISGMNSINVGERNTRSCSTTCAPNASAWCQQGRAGRLPAQGVLPAGQRQGDGQAAGLDQHRRAGWRRSAPRRARRATVASGAARSTCSERAGARGRLHGQDRVVVVDDSALVRGLLAEIINRQPDMTCIGAAADPLVAREMIRNLNPDVITLDVEMPRMDGIDFLGRLMRLRPMPVVMVSTLTERGAEVTLQGAGTGRGGLRRQAQDRRGRRPAPAGRRTSPRRSAPPRKARVRRLAVPPPAAARRTRRQAAGAGGAGPPVDREDRLHRRFHRRHRSHARSAGRPAGRCPGVMITQHMPPGFTKSYAARLDSLCRIRVAEASDGERVLPGHAYIAPGGLHLSVERSGANYIARVRDGEPVNRHKPSRWKCCSSPPPAWSAPTRWA
jgi:two-component system chemotaxis response regulator CheB